MKTHKKDLLLSATLFIVLLCPAPVRALVDMGQIRYWNSDERAPLDGADRSDSGLDMREDIRRGQEFLKDKTAGATVTYKKETVTYLTKKGRKRQKTVTEKIVKPNFLLAVENPEDKRIRQVLVTDKGCVTKGFDVIKRRGIGVGSRFEVVYPENMVVLALRTTVKAGEKSYKEVVYTPYSPGIDTWQVRRAGLSYLTKQIELAQSDLQSRNVRLTALDRLLADVMPTEVSLVLSIIEHIDPVRFKNCRDGEEETLVREVLTIIGANTDKAYAYSKSPAGARGLFQFIPGTYKRLQDKYPEARLKKSFELGTSDHVNAAKASLLLFDSDLSDLPRNWLSTAKKDVRQIGSIIAAAYNCGSRRVWESTKACGDQWTCRLPEETKIYLKKFDVVWDLRKALGK